MLNLRNAAAGNAHAHTVWNCMNLHTQCKLFTIDAQLAQCCCRKCTRAHCLELYEWKHSANCLPLMLNLCNAAAGIAHAHTVWICMSANTVQLFTIDAQLAQCCCRKCTRAHCLEQYEFAHSANYLPLMPNLRSAAAGNAHAHHCLELYECKYSANYLPLMLNLRNAATGNEHAHPWQDTHAASQSGCAFQRHCAAEGTLTFTL